MGKFQLPRLDIHFSLPGLKKSALAVGLDIGSHAVKICEYGGGGEMPVLHKLGSARLPEGAVEDGVLQDAGAVGAVVKALMANLKIKSKDVAISMSGYSVIVKKITLAAMSDAELDEHIRNEAEQYIPFDIDDVYLDYQMVTSPGDDDQVDIMLVAAKKDVMDSYLAMLTDIGLRAVVVDVDAFALENAFDLAGLDKTNTALIDIGATKISINIIVDGASILARDVVMGSAEITRSIATRLGVEAEEAEGIKVGLRPPADDQRGELEEIFVDACSQWILEIKKALDFYASTHSDPIDQIVISGGAAKIKGLTTFLEKETGITTILLDPFAGVKADAAVIDPDYLAAVAPEMAIAAGLARRKVEI